MTIDDRIRQLVGEMVEAAPPAGPLPLSGSPHGRDRRRPARALVAAVVVLLGVSAVLWFTRDDGTSGTVAADLDDPSRDDDGLLVLGRDEWLVPTDLPDGLAFSYALVADTRSLVYSDPGGPAVLSIGTLPAAFLSPADPADVRELGGRAWDRLGGMGYALQTTDGWVLVGAVAIEDAVLEQIIESFVVRPSSALTRPPLDTVEGPYVAVASSSFEERSVTLEVATDGFVYASRVDGGSSCCVSLREGELLRMAVGSGPVAPGEALLTGFVDESVAVVELRPADGATLRIEPQDLDGDLPIDFFLAVVPTTSEVLLGPLPSVVVYDAAGAELGRAGLDEGVVTTG